MPHYGIIDIFKITIYNNNKNNENKVYRYEINILFYINTTLYSQIQKVSKILPLKELKIRSIVMDIELETKNIKEYR